MLKTRATYRLASALALATSLMLIWLSLGVGIIGADGDSANVVYFGVIATGLIGAVVVRARAAGMMRVLIAMATAQALITLLAVLGEWGMPWSGPAELILLNGFFIALFVASAWLFRRSALDRPS